MKPFTNSEEEAKIFEQTKTEIAAEIIKVLKSVSPAAKEDNGFVVKDCLIGYSVYFSNKELDVFCECYGKRPNEKYVGLMDKIFRAAEEIAILRGDFRRVTGVMSDELIASFEELIEDT